MDSAVGKRLQDQSAALARAKAMLDGVMDAVALDGNVPERVEPVESASKNVGAEFDGLARTRSARCASRFKTWRD